MSDAYRCDICEEFKDGVPDESLWTGVEINDELTWRRVGDVCSECWNERFRGSA